MKTAKMQKQKGESLIGLMIGLLVSMIAIAGMLMIFREVVQVSTTAGTAAKEDGERLSTLASAHLLLQKAGFGLEDPQLDTDLLAVNQLVWYEETEILQVVAAEADGNGNGNGNGPCNNNGNGPTGNGNENSGGQGNDIPCDETSEEEPDPLDVSDKGLVWAWDPELDGNLECLGIVPSDEAHLKLLRAACGGADDWASVSNWEAIDLGESVVVDMQVIEENCQPYGFAVTGAVKVELTVELATTTTAGAPITYTSSTCLTNFAVTP